MPPEVAPLRSSLTRVLAERGASAVGGFVLAPRFALGCALLAGLLGPARGQSIVAIPSPSVPINAIDMDRVGPVGPTDLAALRAAARPRDPGHRALRFAPSSAASSRYDSGTSAGRVLALDPSGALALVDPQGSYRAGDLRVELAGLSTELGLAVGDYSGPLELRLFAGAQLVASTASAAFTSGTTQFFRAVGVSFDAFELRAPLGSDFVVGELAVEETEGLFAAFDASGRSGASPLVVDFVDRSRSSAPGGIASWAWDLDGDGLVDSRDRDPRFVYAACGDYDVSLTVTDALHGSSTHLERAFVRVDPLAVDFEAEGTCGCALLAVLFRARTAEAATSFAWDFEDDGIVDSTARHPRHVFATPDALFDVRLTVTSACRPSGVSAVKRGFVRTTGVLVTRADANLSGAAGGMVAFDLEVRAPLVVHGLDCAFAAPVGVAVGLDLYLSPAGTSASGLETQPAAWTLAARDDGTALAAGAALSTRIRFAAPLALPRGRFGVALLARGAGHRLTALTTSGWEQSENAYLSLRAGSALSMPFSGDVRSPRIWNGALLYCLACAGDATTFGSGCADAGGRLVVLDPAGCPDLGSPFALALSAPGASPFANAWLAMGTSRSSWRGIPLPFALDPLGALGCALWTSDELLLGPFALPAGSLSFALIVPEDPLLTLAPSYWQALLLDPAAGALGLSTSNALSLSLR
jgi:hypothetical protein